MSSKHTSWKEAGSLSRLKSTYRLTSSVFLRTRLCFSCTRANHSINICSSSVPEIKQRAARYQQQLGIDITAVQCLARRNDWMHHCCSLSGSSPDRLLFVPGPPDVLPPLWSLPAGFRWRYSGLIAPVVKKQATLMHQYCKNQTKNYL